MDEQRKLRSLKNEEPREYSTKDIILFWYPAECSHSGKCWQGLPGVFKPEKVPWIDIKAAPPQEIIRVVDTCPTGALKYKLPEGSQVDPEKARGPGWIDRSNAEQPAAVKIRVIKDGPLLLEGPAQIHDSNGNLIKDYNRFVLCRCGISENKPFCDGSHIRVGWKSEE